MKLAVRLAVPVLAVAALAGCAPSSSTAAVVAGKTITRGQVDAALEACKTINPRMPELLVVQSLTLREVAFKGYEQIGAPVDEVELDKVVRQDPAVKQVEGTACWPVAQGFFLFNAMQTSLEPAQVEVFDQVPVELNPRYGKFDLREGWDPEGGSLSVLSEK